MICTLTPFFFGADTQPEGFIDHMVEGIPKVTNITTVNLFIYFATAFAKYFPGAVLPNRSLVGLQRLMTMTTTSGWRGTRHCDSFLA
jgi:hypothetical protein